MNLLSSIIVSSSRVSAEILSAPGERLPDFKENQVIKGRVVRMVSPRTAVLDIGGKSVTAKLSVPLSVGDELMLKVSLAGEKPAFRVLQWIPAENRATLHGEVLAQGRSGPFARLAPLLGGTAAPGPLAAPPPDHPLAPLFQALMQAAATGKQDAEAVRTLLLRTGLNLEGNAAALLEKGMDPELTAKLLDTDVKAVALKLAASLERSDEGVAAQLKTFTEGLETAQLVNRLSFQEAGRFWLPLPFLSEEALAFGQLLLDLGVPDDRKKSTGQRTVRIALLLEMSVIGDVRADALVLDKAVAARLKVVSEEVKDLFEASLPEFAAAIEAHGFTIRSFSVEVAPAEELAATNLVNELAVDPDTAFHLIV